MRPGRIGWELLIIILSCSEEYCSSFTCLCVCASIRHRRDTSPFHILYNDDKLCQQVQKFLLPILTKIKAKEICIKNTGRILDQTSVNSSHLLSLPPWKSLCLQVCTDRWEAGEEQVVGRTSWRTEYQQRCYNVPKQVRLRLGMNAMHFE